MKRIEIEAKKKKKHTRRRLRLFELFERKEHGCTQILCLLFILVQHAVCISSSKIKKKKNEKKNTNKKTVKGMNSIPPLFGVCSIVSSTGGCWKPIQKL